MDFCDDSGVVRVRGHRGTCLGRSGSGWEAEVFRPWSLVLLQHPAARRATAAATRSVSRERFGLGAAIRILDEMKFPTLDEMKFLTRGEVNFGANF